MYMVGDACLVTGSMWTLYENLHSVSYHAKNDIRHEMKPDILKALRNDLKFTIPYNYQRGAVSFHVIIVV